VDKPRSGRSYGFYIIFGEDQEFKQMRESELFKIKNDIKIIQQVLIGTLDRLKTVEDAVNQTEKIRN